MSMAVGQLLRGVLGDRLCPIKLVTFGLLLSGIANLLMGFATALPQLVGIWFLNGFALAFIWPPITKILARHMPVDYLKKTCFNLQTSVALRSEERRVGQEC